LGLEQHKNAAHQLFLAVQLLTCKLYVPKALGHE